MAGTKKKKAELEQLAKTAVRTGARNLRLCLAAVLLVTLVAFSPAFKGGFTNWDDNHYVRDSQIITSLAPANIKKIFSTGSDIALNYHPLTILSLALDYHYAGLSPARYHAVNVLLHLLNCALVFFFIYLIGGRRLFPAFFVALFFGIHPMHVESVAWVSERKDVLYTLFFLAGLIAYRFYLEKGPAKFLALAFSFFVLSLLSKAMAVAFPVVLLLLDYHSGRKLTLKSAAEKLPFFALSLIFGLLAVKIQSKGAIADFETSMFSQRLYFGFYGFSTYIWKMFVPVRLSAFHPYPFHLFGKLPVISFYLPVAAGMLAFVVFGALAFVRKEWARLIAFGTGFYFVTIALVLQFVSVGQAIIAERYSYIPYIGLLFIPAAALDGLMSRRPALKKPLVFSVVALALFFAFVTYGRVKVWGNSGTLWTDVIAKYPYPPWLAEVAYESRGEYFAKERGELDRGLADYYIAEKLTTLMRKREANQKLYKNMGNALGLKGLELEKAGFKDKAAEMYARSVESLSVSALFNPGDAKTFVNRAVTYTFMRRHDLAAADFGRALALAPGDPEVLRNRAYASYMSGKNKEAVEDYDALIAQTPSNNQLYLHRGIARSNLKMYREAIEDFNTLAGREPRNGNAFFNLSVCYRQLGESAKALASAEKAVQLGYPVDRAYLEELRRLAKK